jgi:hypothetical protein
METRLRTIVESVCKTGISGVGFFLPYCHCYWYFCLAIVPPRGGVTKTNKGPVIAIFHQYVHMPMGKTIHTSLGILGIQIFSKIYSEYEQS